MLADESSPSRLTDWTSLSSVKVQLSFCCLPSPRCCRRIQLGPHTQKPCHSPNPYRSGSRGRCYVHFDHHDSIPDADTSPVRSGWWRSSSLLADTLQADCSAEQQQQTSPGWICYVSVEGSADYLRKCSRPRHWMGLGIPPPPLTLPPRPF